MVAALFVLGLRQSSQNSKILQLGRVNIEVIANQIKNRQFMDLRAFPGRAHAQSLQSRAECDD
jgi:hypothetical protein